MNENIFEDVERDVASDEECAAILEELAAAKPSNRQKVK